MEYIVDQHGSGKMKPKPDTPDFFKYKCVLGLQHSAGSWHFLAADISCLCCRFWMVRQACCQGSSIFSS